MKKLLFVLIAVSLGITSCEKIEKGSEEVLMEIGVFGDWSLYKGTLQNTTDSVFTDLRITPPNRFELLNGARTVVKGKISTLESDSVSCSFNFYPGKKINNLEWHSQSRLLGCSYMLLTGDTLEIGPHPMDTFTLLPRFYFTRNE